MLSLSNPSSTLTWQAHPLRQRPGAAVFAIAMILATTAAVWLSFGAWWAAGAATALVLSLNRFLFSSRFTLDERGITARYALKTQRITWNEIRRFSHDRHGGYLSRRAIASRLDAYTGLHLLFDGNAESEIQAIRGHISQQRVRRVAESQTSLGHGVEVVGGRA